MLSPQDRDAVLEAVSALRRTGVGVLQVTHEPEDLLWASEVVALAGGRVTFRGAVDEFWEGSGLGWAQPAWGAVTRELQNQGLACPDYPAVVSWLEGGG